MRDKYVQALLHEMHERTSYLGDEAVHTVYFGGGTPSQLTLEQLRTILQALRATFPIDDDAEITLEANPGDLNPETLVQLRSLGFNRLSIGIQSLNDRLLTLIGRRHSAAQAIEVVHEARQAGFRNLSVDLIYGLPGQTMQDWKDDVARVLSLSTEHLSAYCLSYEEGTPLTRMRDRKEVTETDEDTLNAMYDYLVETLEQNGLMRYEVSNFALSGYESQHNSSYWNGTRYLGLGAGAHSFDGQSRQWNKSDLPTYLSGKDYFERELLSEEDRYNELVMLSLRTREGLDLESVSDKFQEHVHKIAGSSVENGLLARNGNRLVATQKGIHILNRIIEDLMI